MAEAKKAVGLVVALVVGGLLAAFLMPIAIDAISGPEDVTNTLDTGETVTLQDDLNVTLDSTTSGTNATYTVTGGADSATTTVAVGGNQTVTVNGASVTISTSDATATNATQTIEYPTDYGWGGGAASLWGLLPMVLVLAVFLYFVYRATQGL